MLDMTQLVSLAKRRGFVFQNSEIYGGLAGVWDYGPYGVQLKKNIQESWWKSMVLRPDVVGLDSSILMNAQVWKASGHVDHFTDPMVDCKDCKSRFREDQLEKKQCLQCGSLNLTPPRDFNLMFKTQVGLGGDDSTIYLRPETAQGIFVNFLNVQSTMRLKLPFGIAQVGKAFRNEITPGNFIFRTREFEQMEMQYFVKPGEQKQHVEYWKEERQKWFLSLGIKQQKLRMKRHEKMAHYADDAYDIEYQFPFGFQEVEGIHSRTDFDLSNHQTLSGKNLNYVDQQDGNKKFLPYVVETSVGLGRTFMAVLSDAYNLEAAGTEEERAVLKFNPQLSPIQIAVMPLMKKDDLVEVSKKIFYDVVKHYRAEYDESGSIGKRYRRQDEIGTPYCVTVDFDSLEDKKITLRNRDTMQQERISIDGLKRYLEDLFA